MPQEQAPEDNQQQTPEEDDRPPLKPQSKEWAAIVEQFGDKTRLREASYGNRPNSRPNNSSSHTSRRPSPPTPPSNSAPSADDQEDGVELIVHGKSGRDKRTISLDEMNTLMNEEEARRKLLLEQREKNRQQQGEGPAR